MYCDLPTNEIADGYLSWEDPQVQAHIHDLIWGEWYEDEDGFLYIVAENADEWVYGPDNEMADKIAEVLSAEETTAVRDYNAPWNLHNVIEGLVYIDYILRRFSPESGFYHA